MLRDKEDYIWKFNKDYSHVNPTWTMSFDSWMKFDIYKW